mgnify:CR=1 FL=1
MQLNRKFEHKINIHHIISLSKVKVSVYKGISNQHLFVQECPNFWFSYFILIICYQLPNWKCEATILLAGKFNAIPRILNSLTREQACPVPLQLWTFIKLAWPIVLRFTNWIKTLDLAKCRKYFVSYSTLMLQKLQPSVDIKTSQTLLKSLEWNSELYDFIDEPTISRSSLSSNWHMSSSKLPDFQTDPCPENFSGYMVEHLTLLIVQASFKPLELTQGSNFVLQPLAL